MAVQVWELRPRDEVEYLRADIERKNKVIAQLSAGIEGYMADPEKAMPSLIAALCCAEKEVKR